MVWRGTGGGPDISNSGTNAKKLEIWSVLDALSLLLPVIGMGLGLATFAVGSQYGTPTGLPWGINLWGEIRHPVQLYQTFGFLLIMIFQLRHLKGLDSDGDNSPKRISAARRYGIPVDFDMVGCFTDTA